MTSGQGGRRCTGAVVVGGIRAKGGRAVRGAYPEAMAHHLSEADVRKVAKLARLELTDAQVHADRSRLARVLEYVEHLSALDLTNVEPMTTPLVMHGPMGDDVPGTIIPHQALMDMAPAKDEPFIKVPKVLGDGGGA